MIQEWCCVGMKKWTGSLSNTREILVWEPMHYNKVYFYNEIHYDFTKEEAEAMCKLLNEGIKECKLLNEGVQNEGSNHSNDKGIDGCN